MSKNDKISITANHKRSLSVTSHHIENSINDIEKILTNNHGNNLTEKFIKNMNEETRKEILKLMGKVRRKNEKMFNELKLHSSKAYEDRIIRSRISHMWTLLCDSTPESLSGYGEVTEEQGKLISKHVNSLLETINKIQEIIFKEA
jgi:hypothetical protein